MKKNEQQKSHITETHDFNLDAEKLKATGTTYRKVRGKYKKNTPVAIEKALDFDKIGLRVDLAKYADKVNFTYEKICFIPSDKPHIPFMCGRDYENYLEEHPEHKNDNEVIPDWIRASEFEDEDKDFFIELQEFVAKKRKISSKCKKLYHNQKLRYGYLHRAIGVNNIFINNGYIYIQLSGKCVAGKGDLGLINSENISKALKAVLDIKVISFDPVKLCEVAEVYKCDVTQDVTVDNPDKYIESISAYIPLCSNENVIGKYSTTGITAYKKSKTNSCYLSIYNKGKEVNRSKTPTLYQNIIGDEGCNFSKKIVRFELRLQTKTDLLANFKPEGKNLLLSEMLDCKTPLILERLKKLHINKKKILEEIDSFHEDENKDKTETFSSKQSINRLAQERFIEILKMHNFDLSRAREHLFIEHNITPTQFSHILSGAKSIMTDFLIYRMPVATKKVLKLLEKLEG